MKENSIFKKILDNYISGGIFFNKEKKIEYVNKIFEILTGIEEKSILGKNLNDHLFKCENTNEELLCSECCPIEYVFIKRKLVKRDGFINNKIFGKIPVSISAFPVYNDNEFIGVFCSIEDNVLNLLQSKKIKQLEQVALLDELTGLPNRRLLNMTLYKCFSKLKRFPDYNFGILFFDIDNFKKINDTYGHKIGDEVLKKIGELTKTMLRKYDICCRYGGEEFIAVLQYIDLEKLKSIAERLRIFVQENLKVLPDNEKVTISIGATLAQKSDTVDSIIKRADELMYQSKLNGKNRVTIG